MAEFIGQPLFSSRTRRHPLQTFLGPAYSVADIHCSNCGETLGWKHSRVYEELRKYKEGKFILEKSKILKEY